MSSLGVAARVRFDRYELSGAPGVLIGALPFGCVIGLLVGTAGAHLARRGYTAFGRETG